ncbi:hypothetical protein MC885_018223 [Smutsia gigantea]|nr:hypothetical protein MC885_018223 [Smutsia gigantea]
MPKGGRKGGHKGRARQYTSPEEIDAQLQAEKQKARQKRKGVEGLIDIENPNRVAQTAKKVTQLDLDGPKELSRRERVLGGSSSSMKSDTAKDDATLSGKRMQSLSLNK